MSWWDQFDDAMQPLSPAEATYYNQAPAREAYYAANPTQRPTFNANEQMGLADIMDRGNIQTAQPTMPAARTGGGADAGAIIRQWQQSHGPDEPLDGLITELKNNGIDAGAFMYGSTASGNEITVNGQKYKVKTGDNRSWYDPNVNPESSGGGGGQGGMTQAFVPPPAWSEQFTPPTLADLQNDTGYQEQLKRGQQAIERSAAARGTVLNPGTLKDLADWSQGTASQEMDKLYARKTAEYGQRYKQYLDQYGLNANTFGINYGVWNDDVNRFINQQNTAFNQNLSLAQLGLNSANQAGQAGSLYGMYGGQALTGAGDANASGIVGGANAINQGIGAGLNNLTSLYALSRYGTGNYGTPYVNRMVYTPGLIGGNP